MIPEVVYKTSSPSVKEEKKATETQRYADVLEYLHSRYVPCTGREFDLTLTIEALVLEIYQELEHMCPVAEIKAALLEEGFNLKKVGDKRIAYARRTNKL
jgi:hypothetical protein